MQVGDREAYVVYNKCALESYHVARISLIFLVSRVCWHPVTTRCKSCLRIRYYNISDGWPGCYYTSMKQGGPSCSTGFGMRIIV
jgi:hypothetical protein